MKILKKRLSIKNNKILYFNDHLIICVSIKNDFF